MIRSRWLTFVLAAGLVITGPAGIADAARDNGVQGSSGLGDPFFPLAGNGGYDVDHYDLDLSWDPATGELSGKAVIEAQALQTLRRFNLDLRGFTVSRVTVDGDTARVARDGQELIITPEESVEAGDDMRVVVRYSGVPETVIDPDGALDGWIPTHDGAIALSEPQGSPSWFPANDYPTDKATFSLSMTVPSSLTVLSNGLPGKTRSKGERTTYTWRERRPMATYLATVAIGHYDVTTSATSSGIPIIVGVDPQLAAASQPSLDRIGEMLDWEIAQFGRYPFESVGAIAVDAPDVGYALETQTRPVFTAAVDDSTLVHELAHQWFGDSVSLASWPEMWLNEGFATYVEWMWAEHEGGPTVQQQADDAYASKDATDPFWAVAPGPDTLPDPSQLFSEPVYLRGAMTLQALRTEIGDDVFFPILRRWAQTNRNGNVSTAGFISFAEAASGRDLTALFDEWLSTPVKPATSPTGSSVSVAQASTARVAVTARATTRR
jgi:aminopeptidase N